MTPVVLYTNANAIRGCLGITENELYDEMIVSSRFDLQLEVDLDTWLPGHAALASAADATSEAANTSQVEKDTAQGVLAASVVSLETALASGDQFAIDLATAAKASAEAAFVAATEANALALSAKAVARKSHSLLTLYSMWFCAVLAAGIMKMAAPKKNTNGKDAFERFAVDLENITSAAQANADKFKDQLKDDQQIVDDLEPLVLAARSIPEYDPMTNEGYTE